jgi:hypothetical protein
MSYHEKFNSWGELVDAIKDIPQPEYKSLTDTEVLKDIEIKTKEDLKKQKKERFQFSI